MKKNKLLVEEQMVSFSRRAILLGGIQLGILGLVVNHLYKIQVSDAKKYSLLSDSNRFNFSLIPTSIVVSTLIEINFIPYCATSTTSILPMILVAILV